MEMPSITFAKRAEKSFDFSKIAMFAPSIGAIILAVVVFVFFVWPKYTEAKKAAENNKALEKNAVSLENKASALNQVDQEQLKVQLAAAELLLPSDKNIFSFIRQIEGVRSTSGVIVNNLSIGAVGEFSAKSEPGAGSTGASTGAGEPPAPPMPKDKTTVDLGDVEAVSMNVSISSDFDQIFTFLNEVYRLPRVSTVSGLTFATDTNGQLTTNMEIHSLWQPRPTKLGAVEDPLPELTKNEVALLNKISSEGSVGTPVEIPDVPKGKSNIFSSN